MSLDGVAGNREVIASLEGEIARRPAHAYLFAGPSGIGKSIVARGVAHNLLCERSPGAQFCCNPADCPVRVAASAPNRGRGAAAAAPRCDCCAACVQIALGVHPDYVYVARQANRSDLLIEQVRDLIDRLGVRPSRGPRRIARPGCAWIRRTASFPFPTVSPAGSSDARQRGGKRSRKVPRT